MAVVEAAVATVAVDEAVVVSVAQMRDFVVVVVALLTGGLAAAVHLEEILKKEMVVEWLEERHFYFY